MEKRNIMSGTESKRDQDVQRDFLKGNDLSTTQNYRRPPPPPINCDLDDLEFMQIDIDYEQDNPSKMEPDQKVNTTIRMFGITQQGNSVAAMVTGFLSYFFVELNPAFGELVGSDLPELQKTLNDWLKIKNGVVHIDLVQRSSVMFYQEKPTQFLQIFVAYPKLVQQLRSCFENNYCTYKGSAQLYKSVTYESNMPYALRFMIDRGIVGMSWLRIRKGNYERVHPGRQKTTCQIEVEVKDFAGIQQLPFEGQYSKIAPLRILSFDIECSAEKGKFPQPQQDPIIQIANIVKVHGESEPFVRNVFTLGSCASIVGSKVIPFAEEKDLLKGWRDFLLDVDPDIITGYNIVNFDLYYILQRSQALHMSDYPKFSRIKTSYSRIKSNTFSSKALGTRETKDINIEGRIQFDMLQVILREHKLTSYSLNSVSAHFLKEQKEDVHHSIISELQAKNEYTRRRLAVYCIKDAYLPLRLLEKLMCLFNLTEMARVTGVPIRYLFTRGQQIKVASQLYRKAREQGLVIPVEKSQGSDGKYEGAIVIEPTKGYYTDPVATLDFASLYPSIMMAHNLCYSTLVPSVYALDKLPDRSMAERTPNGDYFVTKNHKKGLLPMILEELINARKKAKQELAKATDPFEKAVLDGRQLALKISANSVYGFTGAQVGQLPCLAISSSVTAYGRQMIEATKKYVLEKYNKKNGYTFDSQVIYGDTDSVMVKFGVETIEEAMALGKEAAEYVSQFFTPPIKLEFEKVYCPYLLMNKKRYAGLLWTKPSKYDKMDAKGIETVRRDNCGLVKDVVQTVLDKLLIEKNKEEAIAYCKATISDLLQNKIDLSLLVITKGLGKKTNTGKEEESQKASANTYAAKQAHVELAERMRKRDEASAPAQGDRVAYVMIKGAKGSKGYENSEDPLYVLEKNLPIDCQFYLEHQIKLPLLRLFEPILSNPEQTLFTGDHCRQIYIPKVSSTAGGMAKFVVVRKSCLGCKNILQDQTQVLCGACKPKMKDIYIEKKLELNEYEKNYSDLWVQCQRCQGSLHEDILCQSRDCPIFYRRVKAKKNLQEMGEVLNNFLDW